MQGQGEAGFDGWRAQSRKIAGAADAVGTKSVTAGIGCQREDVQVIRVVSLPGLGQAAFRILAGNQTNGFGVSVSDPTSNTVEHNRDDA